MIDRIVIDNFKSIKHADAKLQKVNLLIGPNNSGKSNFLKVFPFLKEKLDSSKGRSLRPETFIGKLDYDEVINKEDTPTSVQLHIGIDSFNFTKGQTSQKTHYLELNSFLKNLVIFKPLVNKIIHPYPIITAKKHLLNDASNLSSFLQYLLQEERIIFNKITTIFKTYFPLFVDITLRNVLPQKDNINLNKETEKQIFVQFGMIDENGKKIWAEELSEGAIYFLSILCIIYQPDPPKLVLLEEPETGIHPRRIKEIIDLIKLLVEEKDLQVIMTTHSPLVVDLFQDEPESIFVFEMKDGFTEIKNLQTDIIEPANKELKEKGIDTEKDYGVSLGDQWVYGLLGGVPA